MIAYIDEDKAAFRVEPICKLLPIAPSTYYETRSRPPSAREFPDTELKAEIARVQAFGLLEPMEDAFEIRPRDR